MSLVYILIIIYVHIRLYLIRITVRSEMKNLTCPVNKILGEDILVNIGKIKRFIDIGFDK